MSFAYPKLLILLVAVPFTLMVAFIGWHLRRQRWREFVAARLRGRLVRTSHPFRHWFTLACLLLASALLCIAVARPRKMISSIQVTTRSHDIMFAIDLSKSMLVSDVKPNRLVQAKTLLYEMSDAMPDERVGLVGFAGTAHLFTPLTIDHGSLRETLDQLDPEWIPTGGSDLASGVRAGIEALKKGGSKSSALIVLSDGEENEDSAAQVIDQANRAGVRIITVGVGTSGGGLVPKTENDDIRRGGYYRNSLIPENHAPVTSKLETAVLQKLADGTRGKYIAANQDSIVQVVRGIVADLEAHERDQSEQTVYREYFMWFVAPAALLLLLGILGGTRWKSPVAVAAMIAVLALPQPLKAEESSEAAAWQERAKKALTRDRAAAYQLGAGDAAYRAKDYSTAAGAYSEAQLTDDAKVSAASRARLGNTLFQLGWQKITGGPASDGKMPDLASFEQIANKKLTEWFDPRNENVDGLGEFDTVIKNWTDAIRQYDSIQAGDDDHPTTAHNRELTVRYLHRLREMLKQQQQMMQQAVPQRGKKKQKGPGQPGEGDPQSGDNGDEEEGDDGEEPDDSQGGEERDKGDSGDRPEDQKDGDQGDKGRKPGESPEDHAKRMLNDKADEAKKPLQGRGTHGGARQRPPAKDW